MSETIDERISEIEARAAKATVGPWYVAINGSIRTNATETGEVGIGPSEKSRPDREFAAHSREDVPWLVAELKRAKAINQAAELLVEDIRVETPQIKHDCPLGTLACVNRSLAAYDAAKEAT